MAGFAVIVADGRSHALEKVFTDTLVDGNVEAWELDADEGDRSVDTNSNSTADTDRACAQNENDVPSFPEDLQRFRTNDPLADERPLLPGLLERVATGDGFENNNDIMSCPISNWENVSTPMGWESRHANMGSPFMMVPFDTNMGSTFIMTPPPSAPFAARMGSPFMMSSPLAKFALTHEWVAYGSSPSVQPISDVPAAPPACALDRPRTYDWLETDGLPCLPRGLVLTQSPRVLEELSPSFSSESPLPSSRLDIRNSPVSCVGEDSCSWETTDTARSLLATPLCGNGQCQPCYNHIRGRCFNDACAYCHMPIHAIRRKQKKHQRREQAQIDSKALDAGPQVGGMVAPPKAKCCAGNHHGEAQASTPCQPCFKYIRGQCTLGASCLYCHDKIHTDRHKQKKQLRSAQRVSTRKMETNSPQR